MKKLLLFIVFVLSASTYYQIQAQVELIYDNNTHTGWQEYIPESEYAYAVRMSPAEPCEVITLKYYLKKEGLAEGGFIAFMYEWEGSQPANEAVFEQVSAVIIETWKEIPAGNIPFEGDFVVSISPNDPSCYLAYDEDLNTGRNWTLDITNSAWSEVTEHSYLIRAIVLYTNGEIEELAGIPINVYPNPATDVLNIETDMDIESVTILNTTGQIVFQDQVNQNGTSIDLSNLQKGIYFVRMESEGELLSTKKIMVN